MRLLAGLCFFVIAVGGDWNGERHGMLPCDGVIDLTDRNFARKNGCVAQIGPSLRRHAIDRVIFCSLLRAAACGAVNGMRERDAGNAESDLDGPMFMPELSEYIEVFENRSYLHAAIFVRD